MSPRAKPERVEQGPTTHVSQTAPASKSASHRAWTEALGDRPTRDALEEGLADVEAGRTKPWDEVRRRLRSK